MRRRSIASLGSGLTVLVLASLSLSGCSTMDFAGTSAFGSAQPATQVAQAGDLPNVGADYPADKALSEARSHFRNADFGYSASLYKRVVELSPKDPEGYVGLGASYDRLGRFDLSDRVYASLYTLSGGTAQYYNNLGYSMLLRGNLSAALGNFRKARALDPGNEVVANNIAMLTSAGNSHA